MDSKYGFTLVELMITLFIAAIVLVYAVPSFNTFLLDNRLTTQTNNIVGALSITRSEAILKNMTATLCASSDQATCNTTNWEAGWIIFNDQNANRVVDGSDTIAKSYSGTPSTITIRTIGFDNAGYIQYKGTGFILDSNNDGDADGTFKVCDSRGSKSAMAVNVNDAGNVKTAIDTNGTPDGIVNDVDGNNIGCP